MHKLYHDDNKHTPVWYFVVSQIKLLRPWYGILADETL